MYLGPPSNLWLARAHAARPIIYDYMMTAAVPSRSPLFDALNNLEVFISHFVPEPKAPSSYPADADAYLP